MMILPLITIDYYRFLGTEALHKILQVHEKLKEISGYANKIYNFSTYKLVNHLNQQ